MYCHINKPISKQKFLALGMLVVSLLGIASGPVHAAETGAAQVQPAAKLPAESGETQEMKNKRMQTLEGSKSRWSGQFQLNYSGSTLRHPFSRDAPNPGRLVPPPVVTIGGNFSARYRVDEKMTAGLGTGITTQTPFQGPKKTSLSDPYLDLARSFKFGALHNRAVVQLTQYTNYQYYHDFGYRQGLGLSNESFYESSFGLTTGLALQLDYSRFAAGAYDKSQQTLVGLGTFPYLEYAINDRLNFRTVVGILHYKNEDLLGTDRFQRASVYQTFGLGIAATKSIFVYAYVRAIPYDDKPVTRDNTIAGFSTIINLF